MDVDGGDDGGEPDGVLFQVIYDDPGDHGGGVGVSNGGMLTDDSGELMIIGFDVLSPGSASSSELKLQLSSSRIGAPLTSSTFRMTCCILGGGGGPQCEVI